MHHRSLDVDVLSKGYNTLPGGLSDPQALPQNVRFCVVQRSADDFRSLIKDLGIPLGERSTAKGYSSSVPTRTTYVVVSIDGQSTQFDARESRAT